MAPATAGTRLPIMATLLPQIGKGIGDVVEVWVRKSR
ncbi:hypothetical protein D7316_03425 [Gordonia insulae]|uniref:Uncharacterized protein n=1 Tax=Gordonia insulae TaxID=2420509 RepID=A0A3G8JRL1_9ACTN|nr:hypothetical protein D7316_03425 [Gordonia insulae]